MKKEKKSTQWKKENMSTEWKKEKMSKDKDTFWYPKGFWKKMRNECICGLIVMVIVAIIFLMFWINTIAP